jgi:DNA-binding CsgD family transcriptional regulator
MVRELGKPVYIKAILLLSFFSFVFLGAEYLFDNMMAYVTDSGSVVRVQGYILGVSVIGFLLYPAANRFIKKNNRMQMLFALTLMAVVCLFAVQQHISYSMILIPGMVLFLILGFFGSAVHYMAVCMIPARKYLARIAGISYAFGILLQFLNNNLINVELVEAMILSIFLSAIVVLVFQTEKELEGKEEAKEGIPEENPKEESKLPVTAGIIFAVIVALMACVFATLDNAVTLVHAAGSVDIGQWPRLLLACSGLLAGFLFDIRERKLMNIMMYCVMLLSTICVTVIEFGGSFLAGLIAFYLSAGFFAVFFTVGFMELSYSMKMPDLWAGLGRAVNNACAIVTTHISVALLSTGNSIVIIIVALILFAVISIAMYVYAWKLQPETQEEDKKVEETEEKEKFPEFAAAFSLTEREQEVLQCLLTSDESIQNIAEQLMMSRAALYRHIGNLNDKTDTKSRIGLMQFYYAWDSDKYALNADRKNEGE